MTMSAPTETITKKTRAQRGHDEKETDTDRRTGKSGSGSGRGPRLDINLDTKHAVRASDLIVLPPTQHPSASSATSSSDSTVVCTLTVRVHVSIKGVRVMRFSEGRRNVSSLTLRVSRNALHNLMDIDDALLAQARKDTDEWFGTGNSVARVANVDEFFRSSTATDRTTGIVAKLSLDVSRSSRAPPFSAREGEDVNIVLQLVGIRFLRQHVDVLWRFVSAVPSDGPFALEAHSLPASDDDVVDTARVGPTPEEREAMFTDLFERIDVERTITDARLRDLDSLADLLEDGRDASDDGILEAISDRLDLLLMSSARSSAPS